MESRSAGNANSVDDAPHPTDTGGGVLEESYAWRFRLDPLEHVGACPTFSLGPIADTLAPRDSNPGVEWRAAIRVATLGSPSAPALRALALRCGDKSTLAKVTFQTPNFPNFSNPI